MNTRDKIINHALNVCCDIYGANKFNLINNVNRKGSTIKAKRMFIYYLYHYMEINHMGMKKYFKNINHATSIHHVHKFDFEFNKYAEIKEDFENFLKEMKGFSNYGVGFYEKRNKIKKLLKEINHLKKITDDKRI